MSCCFGFPYSKPSNRVMSGDRLPHIWEVRSSISTFFSGKHLRKRNLILRLKYLHNITLHLSYNSWAWQSVHYVDLLVSKLRIWSSFLRDIVDEVLVRHGRRSYRIRLHAGCFTTFPVSVRDIFPELIYLSKLAAKSDVKACLSVITRFQFDFEVASIPCPYFRPILSHNWYFVLLDMHIHAKNVWCCGEGYFG